MNEMNLILRMNLSREAPEGAGWYLYATGDTGPLIAPQRVHEAFALKIAGTFEEALTGMDDGPTPRQIIASGNGLIRQALIEQLQYAENQARRVPALRRLISFEDEQTQSSEES